MPVDGPLGPQSASESAGSDMTPHGFSKSALLAVAAGLAAGSLVTACGEYDSGPVETTTTTTETTTSVTTTVETSAPAPAPSPEVPADHRW